MTCAIPLPLRSPCLQVSEFRLDMGSSQLAFPVHSWFSSEHKWRVFFGPKAYLPSETPDTLVPYRWGTVCQLQARLPNLQGRCSVLLMWRPCTAVHVLQRDSIVL